MAAQKFSKQKQLIEHCLSSRYDHPTADMIYETVRQDCPNISLGTVYRNLTNLANKGHILRLSFDGAPDRFDWDTSPHYHLHCNICGAVSDMRMKEDAKRTVLSTIKEPVPKILSYEIIFNGICHECLENNN